MIKILIDNTQNEEDKFFQVKCPHCTSEFQFQLEDLKLIEKKPYGRRLIDCPCCGNEFNTVGISFECESGDVSGPKEEQYSKTIEIEIDGVKWWKCDGFYQNRPEDRKLKTGDAIVYKKDSCPEENPVLIIQSFDYDGDIAARCVIGVLPFRHIDGHITNSYYGNFAPCFNTYRMATDEEVKDFLKKYIECKLTERGVDFGIRNLRNLNIERYNKILDEITQ